MKSTNKYPGKARVAWRLATDGETITRATRLALVVGPILVLINQGDRIFSGTQPDWLKVILTFAVPCCVSTWTSAAKDLETAFTHHTTPTEK